MFGLGIKNKLTHWKIRRNLGANNVFASLGYFSNCTFQLKCTSSTISIGENTVIEDVKFVLAGNNIRLVIADNVVIKGGIIWIQDNHTSIQIEEHTTIEEAHLSVSEDGLGISIGKDCMLSHGISIRTGDSHAIVDLNTNNQLNNGASVIVKDHVWIGANATILKGVTINENSVIGTGAVVTRNVDAHSVYSGVPARKIRESITWSR